MVNVFSLVQLFDFLIVILPCIGGTGSIYNRGRPEDDHGKELLMLLPLVLCLLFLRKISRIYLSGLAHFLHLEYIIHRDV